jgi:hypothetical protein
MTYFVWQPPIVDSGFAFAEDLTGLTDRQRAGLRSGEPLGEPLAHPVVTAMSEGRLGDVIGTLWGGRLVSAPLRAVIEGWPGLRTRFVPVALEHAPSAEYWFLNLLERRDCLDRERSGAVTLAGHPHVVRAIRRLVLREVGDAPAAYHVVGVPDLVVVRDDLRDAIEAACAAPGFFVVPDEYERGVL